MENQHCIGMFGLMLTCADFADLAEALERIDRAEREAWREARNVGPLTRSLS